MSSSATAAGWAKEAWASLGSLSYKSLVNTYTTLATVYCTVQRQQALTQLWRRSAVQSLLALPTFAAELAVQALSGQQTPDIAVREDALTAAPDCRRPLLTTAACMCCCSMRDWASAQQSVLQDLCYGSMPSALVRQHLVTSMHGCSSASQAQLCQQQHCSQRWQKKAQTMAALVAAAAAQTTYVALGPTSPA
jgi:hypothetical protein